MARMRRTDAVESLISEAQKLLPLNIMRLFPPRTAQVVESLAQMAAVSPHMILGLILSSVGHLVGHKTTMRPSELHDWFKRALWWHLVIAYSGFEKSEGYNVVKQALKDALEKVTMILGGVDPA
jgi:hypothetical protein